MVKRRKEFRPDLKFELREASRNQDVDRLRNLADLAFSEAMDSSQSNLGRKYMAIFNAADARLLEIEFPIAGQQGSDGVE